MPPEVIFANVADPLTLGTNYVCTDEGGKGGSELEDLKSVKDATGGFLQANSRGKIETINPKYLLCTGATLPAAGTTSTGGYFIDAVQPGRTNDGHDTMSIKAHKRTKAAIVDTVVAAP
jgi:hypothetical protein